MRERKPNRKAEEAPRRLPKAKSKPKAPVGERRAAVSRVSRTRSSGRGGRGRR